MTEQYLQLLRESLQKKKSVLEEIARLGDVQSELVKQDEFDIEAFDKTVDQKGDLIGQLDLLDEGFDSVFNRVKDTLSTEQAKVTYADDIKKMQELIRNITDLSIRIQATEARNKQAVEKYFEKEKSRIKQGREGSSAAMNYYLNMKNRQIVPPHFYDSKK